MESLHALILQERRKKELAEKNIAARKRLQEIGGTHGQNAHINDLKNVTKVAESILNRKDLQKEYEDVLNSYNILNVKMLIDVRDNILRKYDSDPYFVRLLTAYTELLGDEVKKSTLQSVLKRKEAQVKFFDGK
jgi:hypothetical protein